MASITGPYFMGDPRADARSGLRETVHRTSIYSISTGILLLALGIVALSYFLAATITTVYALAVLLMIGGVFQGVSAFSARKWTTALVDVLACVLYIIAGIVAFRQPLLAAGILTFVIAAVYMGQGVMRVVMSLAVRPLHWGWMLFNGLVTFALGAFVFSMWPASTLWLLGTLVGVDMLLSGWTMLLGGLTLYRETQAPSGMPTRLSGPAPA